nr:protein ALP1-like [Pelodiscus sinensis]|eukprot:XP_025040013.1 protein ALP1-like [Pelodiscus sinensis]
MRKSMFQELCVAIALWKLATPDSYHSVGYQLGVRRSTVGAILMEVMTAINSELLHRTVHLRDPDTIAVGFVGLGFPNCGGALDGTRIPFRALPHQAAQYINRKGYFSMVLQALVDHQGQFTDICVGWSGRARYACIFQNLYLYHRLQAGTFFPQRNFAAGDVQMPM